MELNRFLDLAAVNRPRDFNENTGRQPHMLALFSTIERLVDCLLMCCWIAAAGVAILAIMLLGWFTLLVFDR